LLFALFSACLWIFPLHSAAVGSICFDSIAQCTTRLFQIVVSLQDKPETFLDGGTATRRTAISALMPR
jgi:hypothetical protein